MHTFHRCFNLYIVLLLGILACPTAVIAAAPPSPESIDGTIKINAEQLIEFVTKTQDVKIIDSRIRSDREHGFIEGSINLPDTETNCETLAGIIPSLSTPIIFYCNGPKCGRSAVAAKLALSCQYGIIYWFRGGFEEWLSKNYPVILE